RPGELEAFMRSTRVTTLNVDLPADVVSTGIELPFPGGSFDAATSLDVLEHLASQDRPRHLAELVRVARDTVVACTPLGSPGHVEAERELADWYDRTTGSRHRFLDEHLEHGLPEDEEVRALAVELGLELRF